MVPSRLPDGRRLNGGANPAFCNRLFAVREGWQYSHARSRALSAEGGISLGVYAEVRRTINASSQDATMELSGPFHGPPVEIPEGRP